MKTKPWESSVPQLRKVQHRKKLFRRWKIINDTRTYTHWTVVGLKWLTPKEVTFYALLDGVKLEEVIDADTLNYAKGYIPLDSAEWTMHK